MSSLQLRKLYSTNIYKTSLYLLTKCHSSASWTAVSGGIGPQVQCEKSLISTVEGHRAALMDLPPSTILNMNECGNDYYAQAISKHVYQSICMCKYFSSQYISHYASVKMSLWWKKKSSHIPALKHSLTCSVLKSPKSFVATFQSHIPHLKASVSYFPTLGSHVTTCHSSQGVVKPLLPLFSYMQVTNSSGLWVFARNLLLYFISNSISLGQYFVWKWDATNALKNHLQLTNKKMQVW